MDAYNSCFTPLPTYCNSIITKISHEYLDNNINKKRIYLILTFFLQIFRIRIIYLYVFHLIISFLAKYNIPNKNQFTNQEHNIY